MKSLLCCDVIGFHSFYYARNFLDVCENHYNCKITTKKGGFISVDFLGRNIAIKINHIGINYNDVRQLFHSPYCLDFKNQLSPLMSNQ